MAVFVALFPTPVRYYRHNNITAFFFNPDTSPESKTLKADRGLATAVKTPIVSYRNSKRNHQKTGFNSGIGFLIRRLIKHGATIKYKLL